MGIGDDVLATGMARGAAARGKRIAFGDGTRIRWGPHSAMVFKNNPNVAPPGHERHGDIEWVSYYKGRRIYNAQGGDRWIWNYKFKAKPGEFFFDEGEEAAWNDDYDNLIMIEPNVPNKPCGPNKQWPVERWVALRAALHAKGYMVCQFEHGGVNVVATQIKTSTFRHAAALLKRAKLAILHEGGLHHAAAAVGCPAVVLFGGFVPPAVLGYEGHANLTGGATPCGSFNRCQHCVDAMAKITVSDVMDAAERFL